MRKSLRAAVGAVAVGAFALSFAATADAAGKVRVALGDVASVETLSFLVALERAKGGSSRKPASACTASRSATRSGYSVCARSPRASRSGCPR